MNYNSMIKEKETMNNHEGAKAFAMTPEMELYTAVVTSSLSDKFYESRGESMERIAALVRQVDPVFVDKLAVGCVTRCNAGACVEVVLAVFVVRPHDEFLRLCVVKHLGTFDVDLLFHTVDVVIKRQVGTDAVAFTWRFCRQNMAAEFPVDEVFGAIDGDIDVIAAILAVPIVPAVMLQHVSAVCVDGIAVGIDPKGSVGL